jgi:hypothetical protein
MKNTTTDTALWEPETKEEWKLILCNNKKNNNKVSNIYSASMPSFNGYWIILLKTYMPNN